MVEQFRLTYEKQIGIDNRRDVRGLVDNRNAIHHQVQRDRSAAAGNVSRKCARIFVRVKDFGFGVGLFDENSEFASPKARRDVCVVDLESHDSGAVAAEANIGERQIHFAFVNQFRVI